MKPPTGFTEQVWIEKHKPFYYLVSPRGDDIGIFTKAREVLAAVKPGLRVFARVGSLSTERRQVWPPQ
jgi:hypothetical protein